MKKRNIMLMLMFLVLCSTAVGVVLIFRSYQSWTDEALDELICQNLEAYSNSQNAEVEGQIRDVQSTLTVLAGSIARQEETGSYNEASTDEFLKALGENSDILAQSVDYYRYSEIREEVLPEYDAELLERLKNGESLVTDIYPYQTEGIDDKFYGIAQPVWANGENIGFVRGILYSDSLVDSTQKGFLRSDTTNYLIHKNGEEALGDNIWDQLKEKSSEPEKIEELQEKVKNGERTVVKVEAKDGDNPFYVSYSFLTYNQWVVVNVSRSDEMKSYIDTLEGNGKLVGALFMALVVLMVAIVLFIYYITTKEQKFERERTQLLLNFGDTILCEYDQKTDVLKCTSNISRLLAVKHTEIHNFRSYMSGSDFVAPGQLYILQQVMNCHPEDGAVEQYEIQFKDNKGEYIWCRLDASKIPIKGAETLVVKITDISEVKQKESNLTRKAQTDAYTGLLNREAFKEQVEACLSEDKGGYLFMLDLDDFKEINDKYGHAVGDESVRAMAEVLRRCFRAGDITGRYGGDEFFAFMPGEVSVEVVEERARILQDAVRAVRLEGLPEFKMTCSMGIVKCYPKDSFTKCLKEADQTMYKAKGKGKDSWVIQGE